MGCPCGASEKRRVEKSEGYQPDRWSVPYIGACSFARKVPLTRSIQCREKSGRSGRLSAIANRNFSVDHAARPDICTVCGCLHREERIIGPIGSLQTNIAVDRTNVWLIQQRDSVSFASLKDFFAQGLNCAFLGKFVKVIGSFCAGEFEQNSFVISESTISRGFFI